MLCWFLWKFAINYKTKHVLYCLVVKPFWETGSEKNVQTFRKRFLLSPTLLLKSGGSVLAPVRRFTRKAFQLEYLCCIPARGKQEKTVSTRTCQKSGTWHNTVIQSNLLFGGTRGLPLEAHQPTGCTSGIHKLHQKSLLVSLSKPSYLKRALNPATQNETDQYPINHKPKLVFRRNWLSDDLFYSVYLK